MKKIISVLLTVAIIIGACCISASAASETSEAYNRLYRMIYDYYSPGYVSGSQPYYSDSSMGVVYQEVVKGEDVLNDPNSTDDDYTKAADDIQTALDNRCVRTEWAEETYKLCMEEPNDNWYSEEMWQDYMDKLADLRTALDGGNEYDVQEKYTIVCSKYMELCNSYGVLGDLDKNGYVGINDVTLLQMYLSGMATFNGNQIGLSAIDCKADEISITCVSKLQLHISCIGGELTTRGFDKGFDNKTTSIVCPRHPLVYPFTAKGIKRNIAG